MRSGECRSPPSRRRRALAPLPHDPGPHWGEVGIHGLHRQRTWDEVATVRAPGERGDATAFAALSDGRLVVEAGANEVAALAAAALSLPRPYRAEAVARGGGLWAVGARTIETVDLGQAVEGQEVVISWDGVERGVTRDGSPTLADVDELERLGRDRHPAFVLTARRLSGGVWEVEIAPL